MNHQSLQNTSLEYILLPLNLHQQYDVGQSAHKVYNLSMYTIFINMPCEVLQLKSFKFVNTHPA